MAISNLVNYNSASHTKTRGIGIGGHRGQGSPYSLQQAVAKSYNKPVNQVLSPQLLHMLLVLKHELTSGMHYLDNSNVSLTVN